MSRIRGVVFDLGGVVFDSPFPAIRTFEVENGLPPGAVTAMIGETGRDGPWGRLERGEIKLAEFDALFRARLGVGGLSLIDAIGRTMTARPPMRAAIDRLRSGGLATAALTNNWSSMEGSEVAGWFDVFVESVREGCHKPDPEIYEIVLGRLGLPASSVIMLDDIGRNLKVAAGIGMDTIKVTDPDRALVELFGRLAMDQFDPRYKAQFDPHA